MVSGTPKGRKWLQIQLNAKGEKFNLHCCDCGLTHQIAVAIEKNGKIGFAMRRDQARTEKRRARMVLRTLVWKIKRRRGDGGLMPEFLERKLKAEYGSDSKVPYKIMNAKGYMKGPNITPKGQALERKREADKKRGKFAK